MKKYVILFNCFFISMLHSMDNKESLSGLLNQWQQSISTINNLSLENKNQKEKMQLLQIKNERFDYKKEFCCFNKKKIVSLLRNISIVLFMLSAFDQVLGQSYIQ